MRDRFARRKARSAGRALWFPILGGLVVALSLTSCDYVRLLRPSVLKQLRPPMVRLVDFLPELDEQNKAIVGRLFATGGLAEATTGADAVMRAAITQCPTPVMIAIIASEIISMARESFVWPRPIK